MFNRIPTILKGVLCLLLLLIFTGTSKGATIITNHATKWHIAAFSEKPAVKFAAAELQKYLQQISDAKLPLEKNDKQAYNIILSLRDELPGKYKMVLPVQKPGYDGYSIAVTDNVIVIAGVNEQAIIYGVYDLLEHLGCRWFYPTQDQLDPEVVPKLNTVSLTNSSWSVASPVRLRICNPTAFYYEVIPSLAIKQLDWAMKNRYNMIGWQFDSQKYQLLDQYNKLGTDGILDELSKRGMTLHGPAHSFDQLLSYDKYFDKHPEWFGLRNGKRSPQTFAGSQFCWSNAEARNQFVENAAAFIKHAPLIRIFCTIPFDGGQACECDACKKAGAANLLMTLQGELIEKLKISAPGVMVETVGGYGSVPNPPTDLASINTKQRIIFAQWGRNHSYGYNDSRYDKKNLEQWRKAAKGGLTICNYYTDNFAEPWVMMPFAKAMISDRAYTLKNHVDAVYVLMWAPGFWWNHSFNGVLAGRVYYDTTLDPYKVIDDYALHYFGKDAGPLMAAYYQERARYIELSYHLRNGNTTDADRALLVTERNKYIGAALKKVKNNKLYTYRLNKVAKLHNLDENVAIAHKFHSHIKQLRKEGKLDQATLVLDSARVQTDKIVQQFYVLSNLKQGLIDDRDVAGFTSSALKDWLNEEAKLIDNKIYTIK